MVSNELHAPNANSFAKGEANTGLVLVVVDDGEFWWVKHQNVQRKACYK
jgi:hypothetical protein